jgi:glycosyltransferase involved in cell wall biosynthesis
MKVVEVCPRFYPYIGGVETYVEKLSRTLVKKGFMISVFTTDPSGKLPKIETMNDVTIHRFRSYAPHDVYHFSPQMYTELRKERCDIIHAHGYRDFPALCATLAKKRRKFVFTPHTASFLVEATLRQILHKIYKPLGNTIFRAADAIVACSVVEENWIRQNFKVTNKVLMIPHFIEVKNQKTEQRAKPLNKVAYIGRLETGKNLEVLLHAFRIVKETVPAELIIIGDGSMKETLMKMTRSSRGVKFLGAVSNSVALRMLEDEISILVLPSKHESFGLCVLEAMASGVPVVVTPIGDFKDVLEDGKTCLFTKIGDPSDLAKQILTLCKDPKLVQTICKNGLEFVRKNYNVNEAVKQYTSLYQSLANR